MCRGELQGGAIYGMGPTGTDEFECGGWLDIPGTPFCITVDNETMADAQVSFGSANGDRGWGIGLELGNNPRAFSKLGDSTIEHPYFLGRFDDGPYNLGSYGYLKGAILRVD